MTLDKFSTLLYIITIIIVSNVEAKNSCIKQWKDMQAYNAEGKAFFSIFEIDLFDYNIGWHYFLIFGYDHPSYQGPTG